MRYHAWRIEVFGHNNLNKATITVFLNVGDMEIAVEQHFVKKNKVNQKVSDLMNDIVYDDNIGKE